MADLLWGLTVVIAFPLAYSLVFSSITLSMGKELSGTESSRGFQDAITPPWQTNLGLVVFGACAVVVGLMWWEAGFLSAIGSVVLMAFVSSIARLVLPKPTGNHYRNLIIQSMISRYANYVRDGDSMRAEAMKHLLVKAGFDPERFPTTSAIN